MEIEYFKSMKKHNIALVAHDARKKDLVEWVQHNIEILSPHTLYCTGTTGKKLNEMAATHGFNLNINYLKSGPLGGDQQIGALIADGSIDIMIFLVDDLSTQPHDVDVKALARLARLYNIVLAQDRSTADYVITSTLFDDDTYKRQQPDFNNYLNRKI